ncbi:MAG TPA: proton-conducting transporter membrane subunit, partial [Afifellaceae bacterium]|nr:proton-conducting transporter membrane subunit [Afifellaceae bacterium]
QNELRLLLSHVSVAILGLCVMLLGTSLPLAILAALGFLLAHALSMSALLLATGAIADRVGATDINGLRGLARAIPLTCAAIVVAAMTMAGAPGTPGYWAMTLAQDALFSPNPLAQILLALLIPAIALVAAAVIAVVLTPFFRMDGAPAKTAREEPPGIWFGPVILSFGAIVMIVFGAWTGKYLLDPAHLAIALRLGNVGNPPGIHLDAIFAIAAATWILAAVICWARWGRRIQMPRWQPYAEYTAGFAGAVFVAGISLWALVRLSSEFMTGAELRSAGQLQGAAILAMIAAPLIALVRADLRWLFACLIISGLGSVAAGVALGSPIGLAGALAFAIQFPAIITGLLVTVRAARRTCGLPRRKAGERFCGASPILAAVTAVFMFALAG